MLRGTVFTATLLLAVALLGACSNAEVEPEAVTKTFIKTYNSTSEKGKVAGTELPPSLGIYFPDDLTPSDIGVGYVFPPKTLSGYDGYELKCNGAPLAKKSVSWYDETASKSVASSVRRTAGNAGEFNSDVGPKLGIDPTHEYRFLIHPTGFIQPPADDLLSCKLYGLDFS